MPAMPRASTSWAAVTPEPQYAPTPAGSGPATIPRAANRVVSSAALPEMPVAGYVSRRRRADRPRDMPGHRVDRLGLTPVALPRPASSRRACAGEVSRAVGIEQWHAPGPGGEVAGHDRAGALPVHRLASRDPGPVAAIQDLTRGWPK